MLFLRKLLFVFVLGLIPFFLSNCGDKAADTSANFSTIYTSMLKTACAQCHVPGTPAYNTNGVHLDFTTSATAYSTLLANYVAGTSSTGTCSGIKIVAANAPTQSYLAGVLFQDYHVNNFAGKSGCTTYATHLSDQNITPAEEASILAWINAGAPNN